MSALTQYIDLYREHGAVVGSHSCPAMNALRPRALETLENMTLPKKGAEHYALTDLEELLAPDWGLNLAKVDIDVNPSRSFHCGVPMLSTSLFLFINDTFAATPEACEGMPEGVFVGSMQDFARKMPEEFRRLYGSVADMANPLVALNTLLAEDGMVVFVADGVRLGKPLQLVSILENGTPLMAVRRLLIVMGRDSEAKLLACDHTQNPDVDYLSLQTVEIIAGAGSRLDYYDLEESTEKTRRLCSVYLEQHEGSEVLLDGMTLYNGTTRNEYYCSHRGAGGRLRLLGMGVGDGRRRMETYSHVGHEVAGCHTDELFKYVVDDDAAASFEGMIYVAPGAVKTEAYQSNRNIVGSDTARMYSRPQLEIYNDDVKCSHGSAVGRLDAMQLFYMRTRGLPEATARLLLKQAFMADVIEGVRLKPLRERLHIMMERRFSGARPECSSCQGYGCGESDTDTDTETL